MFQEFPRRSAFRLPAAAGFGGQGLRHGTQGEQACPATAGRLRQAGKDCRVPHSCAFRHEWRFFLLCALCRNPRPEVPSASPTLNFGLLLSTSHFSYYLLLDNLFYT